MGALRENDQHPVTGGSNGVGVGTGSPRREGADVPLSEEEQRILQELEQKLYEQDRAFVDRVRAESPGLVARRSVRWAAAAFVAGFVVVVVSFRSSLLLGTFGFLVMLFSALLFERSARLAFGRPSGARRTRRSVGALFGRRLHPPRLRFRRSR